MQRRGKNGRMYGGSILTPKTTCFGYQRIGLCKDSKQRWFYVHRLVANAFIENKANLPQLNHIDENKLNNAVSNLEWCTSEYNINYGHRTEKVSHENHFNAKLTSAQVEEIRKKYKKGVHGRGTYVLAREYGIGTSQVHRIIKGESWK